MPRMCFHIYVSHFRNAKIQIDLCGGNIRMSKHFLHTLHVRSILQLEYYMLTENDGFVLSEAYLDILHKGLDMAFLWYV